MRKESVLEVLYSFVQLSIALLCGNNNQNLSENNQLLSKKCFSVQFRRWFHFHRVSILQKRQYINIQYKLKYSYFKYFIVV